MEKQVIRWSYLLGVICVVLAVLFRAANAMGWMGDIHTAGSSIGYMSFLKGAVLFLLTSIATSGYLSAQKS